MIEQEERKLGFICEAEIINSTHIKVGYNKKQFVVDKEVLGYNISHNPFGSRRTTVPNWNQRVDFNNKLNEILTNNDISANVYSGVFTIRHGLAEFSEEDWQLQIPQWMLHNESRGYYVE